MSAAPAAAVSAVMVLVMVEVGAAGEGAGGGARRGLTVLDRSVPALVAVLRRFRARGPRFRGYCRLVITSGSSVYTSGLLTRGRPVVRGLYGMVFVEALPLSSLRIP